MVSRAFASSPKHKINNEIAKYIWKAAEKRSEKASRIGLKKSGKVVQDLHMPLKEQTSYTDIEGIGPSTDKLILEFFQKKSKAKIEKSHKQKAKTAQKKAKGRKQSGK